MDGMFQYELLERASLEDDLPFDLAETYDLSLSHRLNRYLEVPFEVIEPPRPAVAADRPRAIGARKRLVAPVHHQRTRNRPRDAGTDARVDPISGDDEFTTRSVGDDVSLPSEFRDEPEFVAPAVTGEVRRTRLVRGRYSPAGLEGDARGIPEPTRTQETGRVDRTPARL